MNMFKKKQKNDAPTNWKKTAGSFIRKPAKGWIHPDHMIETSTVAYETQYIGFVKVLESVKTIPFEQRGILVREAIIRCCAASKLFDMKKKKKCNDATINDRLGNVGLDHSGTLTSTTFSKSFIKTYDLRTGENILDHPVQCISFASIGENEYKNFIGYISKDQIVERACFVFDCKGDIADDIILTIGQAFELKYKEYLNCNSSIQPVLTRFTDPVAEKAESENAFSSNISSAPPLNSDAPEYAELFGENNTMIIRSAPGYGSLQRNDNTQIGNGVASPDSRMNFSPCPVYDGKDVKFVAVYDNPISSDGLMKNMSLGFSDGNEVCSEDGEPQEDLYSDPTTSVIDQPTTSSNYQQLNSKPNTDSSMKESWFHGKVSREIAERCIKCDGDFLVRESSTSRGQFVLSGMRDGAYRHILLIDPDGKVQTRDQTFQDVPELIKFHRSKEIPITSGSSEVYLKREISK